MGIGEGSGNSRGYPSPSTEARRVRAAVVADDQVQFEMNFEGRAELDIEAVSEDDVSVVQDALSELDRLEEEIAEVSEQADRIMAR